MADAICMQCTVGDEVVDFPNLLALKTHEMTGHVSRWEKPLPVDPRGDHPSATELKEKKEKTTKPQVDKPTSTPESEVKLMPLLLQYKWQGQCPTCRDTVKTIEVEVDSANLMIAYCVRCDKKLQQQRVIPLPHQKGMPMPKENTFESNMKRAGKN